MSEDIHVEDGLLRPPRKDGVTPTDPAACSKLLNSLSRYILALPHVAHVYLMKRPCPVL